MHPTVPRRRQSLRTAQQVRGQFKGASMQSPFPMASTGIVPHEVDCPLGSSHVYSFPSRECSFPRTSLHSQCNKLGIWSNVRVKLDFSYLAQSSIPPAYCHYIDIKQKLTHSFTHIHVILQIISVTVIVTSGHIIRTKSLVLINVAKLKSQYLIFCHGKTQCFLPKYPPFIHNFGYCLTHDEGKDWAQRWDFTSQRFVGGFRLIPEVFRLLYIVSFF